MTVVVTPPAPVVPIYPPLGSPTFGADAYTYGSSMPTVVMGIKAIADAAEANAQGAESSANAAADYAVSTANAAATALAASNFKGNWSSLSGALAMPASVKNNGRFWLLLNNLANVAASQPGVTADWTALDSGTTPSQKITTAGVTNGVIGVRYELSVGGIVLMMPQIAAGDWARNDFSGFVDTAGGPLTSIVEFGDLPWRKKLVGTVRINRPGVSVAGFFSDSTSGLV